MSAKSMYAHIPNEINEVQSVVFLKHFYLKSAAWWLAGTTLLLLPAGGERKAEVWGGGAEGGGGTLSEEHMAKTYPRPHRRQQSLHGGSRWFR